MVGTRGGKKKGKSQKKKAPTITQEEEPTSPQLNNKEDQKEEEKRNEDGDTAAGMTNPEDSDSSKEKGSSVGDMGIARYWYYLAHTLKSAVWRKSTD